MLKNIIKWLLKDSYKKQPCDPPTSKRPKPPKGQGYKK